MALDLAYEVQRRRQSGFAFFPLGRAHFAWVSGNVLGSPECLFFEGTRAKHNTRQARGKLACVFGCGGDRDSGKRSEMGRIADELADSVIITNDNPRSENPYAIIAAIAEGMAREATVETDRAKAIALAVSQAGKGDVVLVAGKGHEDYQEIHGIRYPFSDADWVQNALKKSALNQDASNRKAQA